MRIARHLAAEHVTLMERTTETYLMTLVSQTPTGSPACHYEPILKVAVAQSAALENQAASTSLESQS
jgi:hypothetical protein